MCNPWCHEFVRSSLACWPASPEVLEVGSRDVNGSVRGVCASHAARYVGCDLQPGPGVDTIADATRLTAVFPPESFDLVISTEMLEHVADWPSALAELAAVLRPGGLLILSARSPGFPAHDYPGDFWRFTGNDIRRIFDGAMEIVRVDEDPTLGYPCGVGVVARKRAGADLAAWRERLELDVAVYSIQVCDSVTRATLAAGAQTGGPSELLRQRIRDLEQRVFDAQIDALRSRRIATRMASEAAQLAACQAELMRCARRIQTLEGSLAAWHYSLFGRLARVADYGWEMALRPLRLGRYVVNARLRSQAWSHLKRRWPLGGRRRLAELPDLDWLLKKLDVTVPPDQVAARLGRYLTAEDEARYRAFIGPLRAAGTGRPSRVVRADALFPDDEPTSRRRRILFVCGEFPNPLHGGGGRVADFIKALSEHHDVLVAAWYDRRHDHEACVELAPYCRDLRGLSLEDLEGGCVAKVMDLLQGEPADFVHYEWPRSLISLDRRLGRAQIYTHMESVSCSLWMDLQRLDPLSPDWLRRLAQLLVMLGVEVVEAGRADAQVVVTAKDGEFLSRFAADRTYYVVNHGIHREEFDLPDRAGEPHTLVFTGNFIHYPNVDAVHYFMQRIHPMIAASVPDVRIWLVGAHPPPDVRRYHDGHSVTVTGRVPDIRPYVQKAAVCIAPLISGAGLRTKVVQYAALRRPCVATPVAVEDLEFEDGRDVCVADGPDAFAARVVELLGDPARAADMAARACSKAWARYDNRVIARRCLGNLYRLLGQDGPRPAHGVPDCGGAQ